MGIDRRLGPLYAAGFVTAFGAHAVAANLAGYGSEHHVSLLELGGLLAIYDGAEIVLKPVFGSLSDRVGAKPVLLGGLVAFAVASALFVVAHDPSLIGAVRLAQGSSAAAFSPAASALVAAAGAKGKRGSGFGGYGGAKGLGYLAGPLGGGLLVAAGGYTLLFTTLAGVAVVVATWAAASVHHRPPQPRSRETLAALARRISDPAFVRPVAVLAASTAAFSAAVGYLPVFGRHAGLGPVATGAAVSALAGVSALVQPPIGRRLDAGRVAPAAAAVGLFLAGAGLAIAAGPATTVSVLLAAVAIGAGVGVSTPLGFAALADAAPAGRLGQTMGAGEVGREFGDAGGPLLVGALAGAGLAVGLAGLGGVIVVAGVIVLRPLRGGGDAVRADAGSDVL
jgi:MFS family permease